jgi:LacI family transcriptional regulator
MITLKDVAARCGYSIAAVSKAINGRPDINRDTAKRIRETAGEMGYVPNTAAQTLSTKTSRIIGLLFFIKGMTIWEHEYFSRIASSVQEVAEQRGYDIAPVNISKKHIVGSCADYCRHRNYDGVLVMSVDEGAKEIMDFVRSTRDIPIVMIDATVFNHDAVVSDNAAGMQELVRYAAGRGHRRIAFIHGQDSLVTQARLKSFFTACESLDIRVPQEYLRTAAYCNTEETGLAAKALLKLRHPPTCILCPDDYASLGAIREIRLHGLRIPEDISIMGYDGIPLSQALYPRLTTYRQDMEGIGRMAAEKLLLEINSPKSSFEQTYLPGWMIAGESVKDLTFLAKETE